MNMAKAQDYGNQSSTLIKGKENHRHRETANDGNCNQRGLSLERLRRHFNGSSETTNKLERVRLPSIYAQSKSNRFKSSTHSGPRNLKCTSRTVFNEQASPQTTQVRQIMPRGFEEFWLHYKPSLAIRSSTICQDIDALSIEIIRQQNQPCVVLPSLRSKNK